MSPSLRRLLTAVSRAFSLTLRALPEGPREPIAVGYLLARAADTIADTPALPPASRLEALLAFRSRVLGGPGDLPAAAVGGTPSERELLSRLEEALACLAALEPADQADVRAIVTTLISGMEKDLARFPGALSSDAELDDHTYLAAGCVGEFWTRVCVRHIPALRGWDVARMSCLGVRFGKALQLTNVLRDVPADLADGRSYLPGLAATNGRELRDKWLEVALGHYEAALEYVLAVPFWCLRLRLAVWWPVLIGLATLRLLVTRPGFAAVKVPRKGIYRILGWSLLAAPFDFLVRGWTRRDITDVRRQLVR